MRNPVQLPSASRAHVPYLAVGKRCPVDVRQQQAPTRAHGRSKASHAKASCVCCLEVALVTLALAGRDEVEASCGKVLRRPAQGRPLGLPRGVCPEAQSNS